MKRVSINYLMGFGSLAAGLVLIIHTWGHVCLYTERWHDFPSVIGAIWCVFYGIYKLITARRFK